MHTLLPCKLNGLRFCPPKLGFLTAVWIAFLVAGAVLELFDKST